MVSVLGSLHISDAKYGDLENLSKFCGPDAHDIFRNAKHNLRKIKKQGILDRL